LAFLRKLSVTIVLVCKQTAVLAASWVRFAECGPRAFFLVRLRLAIGLSKLIAVIVPTVEIPEALFRLLIRAVTKVVVFTARDVGVAGTQVLAALRLRSGRIPNAIRVCEVRLILNTCPLLQMRAFFQATNRWAENIDLAIGIFGAVSDGEVAHNFVADIRSRVVFPFTTLLTEGQACVLRRLREALVVAALVVDIVPLAHRVKLAVC